MTANSANAGCAIVCTGMRGFSTTQLDKENKGLPSSCEQYSWCCSFPEGTPLSTRQTRVSVGSSGFTRNCYTSSVKSVMPQTAARSHRRLQWLLLLITPSATSGPWAALVEDMPACYIQAIQLLHQCPQCISYNALVITDINKLYQSDGLQYRWVHTIYCTPAFCYGP